MAAELVIPTAIRALRAVVKKGIAVIRDRLPQAGHDLASIEPALARNSQRIQQGPAARIRQQQQQRFRSSSNSFGSSRNFTTFIRNLKDGGVGTGAKQPVRTAVFNVSRTTPQTKRRATDTYIRGQIRLHLAAANTDRLAPGAYVDFHLYPKFSALSPTDPIGYTTLDGTTATGPSATFMDALTEDFSAAARDLVRVQQDLRRLSLLGELPISLVSPATLRVHFRGCDADLVTALCDEVGVATGIIHEDERFAYDRLIPAHNAIVDWREMMSSGPSYDDEDCGYSIDWDKYSGIPSHEVNNPRLYAFEALSLSEEDRGGAGGRGGGPHWEEESPVDEDEGYDHVDRGTSSGDESMFWKEEYMADSGGYVNPWVMPTPNRAGVF
ncbi:hypothetical protein DRE_02183 [Drechslerella stenobrocha 248]|uniref:Uncharacterized protein n=1 Tax=Drechslerella stenobrocha 248 TaxID=1043628 RepID=W7HY27_9PEZI|nr:hypothetical protein DRE_02183 [Drechslerella stenobrocha 248]